MTSYKHAYKKAFPYTLPVLTGYLFIGIAFGVMFAEVGYNTLWASLMSLLVFAGSGQYLATHFFEPDYSFLQMIFLTLMVNIRHVFYGVSLLGKFSGMGLRKWYMIFGLTDETYSLLCTTQIPEDVETNQFLFAIATLDHVYWIVGTIIGSLAGTYIPFNSQGIEFAMTALFVVIFLELWMDKRNRIPAGIGILCGVVCLLLFGSSQFVLPSMIAMSGLLILGRKTLEQEVPPCQ